MGAQSLIIDSRLQDHLPISYDQRLPRRYVHTPILQTKQDSPYPSRILTDAGEQYDPKQSLNYHLDAGTGTVRIASMKGDFRKGTLVDTLA
ncbi:MAG: hypothetical protein LLG93_01490 [Deltaproteobacteria bacterium]|nr:hypothetical protein [Deltaproteobacteria bacterium]